MIFTQHLALEFRRNTSGDQVSTGYTYNEDGLKNEFTYFIHELAPDLVDGSNLTLLWRVESLGSSICLPWTRSSSTLQPSSRLAILKASPLFAVPVPFDRSPQRGRLRY